jgi:hypothetical protein
MASSVANYSLFQAIVQIKPAGAGAFVDIGNAPKVSIGLSVDFTEHLSSRTPSPEVDFTYTTKKSGTIDIELEEATAYNLALYALHDGYTSGPITILKDAVIAARMLITGTNDQGNIFEWDLTSVQLRPKGTMELISGNTIGKIPLSGTLLSPFGTITPIVPT